jgi:hypothetical protein
VDDGVTCLMALSWIMGFGRSDAGCICMALTWICLNGCTAHGAVVASEAYGFHTVSSHH